jgi:hypothetical protein
MVQPLPSYSGAGSHPAVAAAASHGGGMSGLAGRVRQLMMQSGHGQAASSSRAGSSPGGRQAYNDGSYAAGATAVGSAQAEDEGWEAPCLY